MQKQFDDVPAKFGAPMGRQEYGAPPAAGIDLFEVRMVDGDYDDGGAYWGGTPSEPLFCARAEEYREFIRAADRAAAADLLGLNDDQLLVPTTEAQVETVLNHYIIAALWSSHDESDPETGGDPMDENYCADDIAPETVKMMRETVADFLYKNKSDVKLAMLRPGYTEASVGHDLWLTQNRHGVGFWDRDLGKVGDRLTKAAEKCGEIDLYVGDDGKIYA